MITLRPHQVECIQDTNRLLQHHLNVLVVLPTGGGKSLTLAEYARMFRDSNQPCVVFAHKDVLIEQLSSALCKMGIRHNFICSVKARRDITNANYIEFGDSFYDEHSPIIVSSNPTFSARLRGNKIPQSLLDSIMWWIQDEAHHHLRDGKLWGSCTAALTNARGLGFTATPIRGDRKGLGREYDGVFDAMSVTSTMWDLIQNYMLSPYKIYQPQQKIDLSGVTVTSGGDYNTKQLSTVMDKREITGDAVEHYLRVARGQSAVTFCTDINHANHVADAFNKAGIPSRSISSKQSTAERAEIMRLFKEGQILNIVNVDLLGEGWDSPGIVCGIMLRPTQSYSLFKQQFGRILRTSEGKSHGILLDHVGNVLFMMTKFGLRYPHDDPEWTLERGTKAKASDDGEKLAETVDCGECGLFYIARDHAQCPDCGHVITEEEREVKAREIQQVSGELVEFSVEAVNALIAKRAEVDVPVEQFAKKVRNMVGPAKYGAMNNHAKRQHSQTMLRDKIQRWCKHVADLNGWDKETVQREFNVQFGTPILKACVLSSREADELADKVPYHDN
jgi:superfamily II DNA or RNA helicase